MAKLNLSQVAKVTGKNRTTIWRHINSGKLSAERDRDGLPFVDTSELLRVYGELKAIATVSNEEKQHNETPENSALFEVIEHLRKEVAEMKSQMTNLTNRLTYTNELNGKEKQLDRQQSTRPEDDPSWPKEIKCMADILLREEIKSRFKS
ncbi:hypothetical protein MO387_20535 [Shewanella sp. N2AIL]|uniref:hypothetical protein n=1 Tax=Shewanella sp. N2AIL TaxID=2926851 RepID=UPI001F58A5EE|nr:hypothetical protein [Shewanella sp. N2AIL]MCI2965441.1 hypothetical protein [Shewanella sp. N2AIL]